MEEFQAPNYVGGKYPNLNLVITPNNGCLYVFNKSINYLHYNFDENDSQNCRWDLIRRITAKNSLSQIECDYNWDDGTKYFFTLDFKMIIDIWDAETFVIVKKCSALTTTEKTSKKSPHRSAIMCATINQQILAITEKQFVKYCIVSNTYISYNEPEFMKKIHVVCFLSACPYNADQFAVGTTNGLIVIVSLDSLSILHNLRAHDSPIMCIEWMKKSFEHNPIESTYSGASAPMQDRSRHIKTIVDKNDIFDIYSFDELENEFGTYSGNGRERNVSESSSTTAEPKTDLPIINENFDYVKACESLKDAILGSNKSDNEADENTIADDSSKTLPIIDSAQQSGSNSLSDLGAINKNEPIKGEVYLLVSGSTDPFICFWDTSEGVLLNKHLLHKVTKSYNSNNNFTASFCWIDDKTLLTTTPANSMAFYNVRLNVNNKKLTINSIHNNFSRIGIKNVKSFPRVRHSDDSSFLIGVVHKNKRIDFIKYSESIEVIGSFTTMPDRIYSIKECPQDLNKLAFGGDNKCIQIINLSDMSGDKFVMKTYASQIYSRIFDLTWHPARENVIAFSTQEGRVGIVDTSKVTNEIITLHQFSSHAVYSICWVKLDNMDIANHVLFACDKNGKLVYYVDKGSQNYEPITVTQFGFIVTVNSNKKFIAFGSKAGSVIITTLSLEVLWSEQISKDYIVKVNWNPFNEDEFSVCTADQNGSIFIFKGVAQSDAISFIKRELKGHSYIVYCINWSNDTPNRLVSSSGDGTVRIWDTEQCECLSVHQLHDMLYSLFSPRDDRFVIACSFDWPPLIFDRTKNTFDAKISNMPTKGNRIEIAKSVNINVKKAIESERKIKKRLEKESTHPLVEIESLTQNLDKIQVSEKKVELESDSKTSKMTFNHLTIMHRINKELSQAPLHSIRLYLEGDEAKSSDDIEDYKLLHQLMFSSRLEMQKLLDIELENHIKSSTVSIGNILLPQIGSNLRNTILQHITNKSLTETHLSLAPSISYTFWKESCLAYAYQQFEKKCILLSIPYLLAVYHIDEAIEALCKNNYYREAWTIAKLNKDGDDKIFDTILSDWIEHVEYTGNFEGAALIAILNKKFEFAIDILNKRKNPSDLLTETISLIQNHVGKTSK